MLLVPYSNPHEKEKEWDFKTYITLPTPPLLGLPYEAPSKESHGLGLSNCN